MLGVYLLFTAFTLLVPILSSILTAKFAWAVVFSLWIFYLWMFAERTIPKKYRYILPWAIAILSSLVVFTILDSQLPRLDLWGRLLLSAIILFQSLLIIASEAIVIMGGSSSYPWFLLHNLVFIIGLSWFLLFSYISWSLLSLIVVLAGMFLFLGLKQWNRKDNRKVWHNLIDPSVVLLIIAGYLILLGLITKLIILFKLDLKIFVSALLGTLLALLSVVIMFWEGLKERVRRFLAGFLKNDSYDHMQEWDNFVSLMEDITDEIEIAKRLKIYLKEKFSISDVWIFCKQDNERFHRILGKESWKIPKELQRWLWYKDCPLEMEELLKNGWELDIDIDWVIVPMIFKKELIGLLLVRPVAGWKKYKEFFYMMARNLAILITVSKISKQLLEAKQFEQFNKMVSFVVHDLKNSLSALNMLIRNWEKQKNNPEFISDSFTTLALVTEKINQLITKLKIYPQKTSKKQLTRRKTSILKLINSTIEKIGLSTIKNVKIKINIPEEITIPLEPKIFEKALENLIINSIEAMDKERREISIWLESDKDFYKLYIKDNGTGMSQEFITTQLFRPFVSTKKEGLGIGMYEVKNIIEEHNGMIDVVSQEGVGTEVIIYLPKEKKH